MNKTEKNMTAKAAWAKLSNHNILRRELIEMLERNVMAIGEAATDATMPVDEIRTRIAFLAGECIGAIYKVKRLIEGKKNVS